MHSLEHLMESFGNSEKGACTLIENTVSQSGDALISYFLAKEVKSTKICFLALKNTWTHYCVIGRKMGLNLQEHCNSGQIVVVDMAKMISGSLIGGDTENPFAFVRGPINDHDLHPLFDFVMKSMGSGDDKFTIMIDCINPLVYLGIRQKYVVNFIFLCYKQARLRKSNFILNITNIGISEITKLRAIIAREATYLICLKELTTGDAKNIDGEIKISDLCKQVNKTFHYKVEERYVKLFQSGSIL